MHLKLRQWFSEERLFWRLCTAVFCAFAVLKGVRAPGDWPLTQAQLDYSHGFIKRGLQGAFLDLLHIHRYHPLSAYFFVQLVVLFAMLVLFTRKANVEARFGNFAPVAIFASSYAVTFLTHIVGYTDIPLAIFTIALLLIRNTTRRFWCSLALLPVAILLHESFLLLFLPVLLVSFLLDAALANRAQRRQAVIYALVLALVAGALTAAASAYPRLSLAEIDKFDDEVQARVDFDIRDDVFNVLSRKLTGSFEEAWEGLHYPEWEVDDLVSLTNLLPVVLLLGYYMRRLLRSTLPEDLAPRQRLIWRMLLLAMLAPLSMYALGVDGGRWNTICVLIAFLEFVLLCRTLPRGSITLSTADKNVAVFVLALNMCTGMGLFDAVHVNLFPFWPAIFETFR